MVNIKLTWDPAPTVEAVGAHPFLFLALALLALACGPVLYWILYYTHFAIVRYVKLEYLGTDFYSFIPRPKTKWTFWTLL